MEIIKDYKYGYKVSSKGYIISAKGKKLKESRLKQVSVNGKSMRVSRIVAEVFFGKLEQHNVVYHIDGDETNHAVENLQIWESIDFLKSFLLNSGKSEKPALMKDVKNKRYKLDDKKAATIRNIVAETGATPEDVAKMYDVSVNTVYNVLSNRTWEATEKMSVA